MDADGHPRKARVHRDTRGLSCGTQRARRAHAFWRIGSSYGGELGPGNHRLEGQSGRPDLPLRDCCSFLCQHQHRAPPQPCPHLRAGPPFVGTAATSRLAPVLSCARPHLPLQPVASHTMNQTHSRGRSHLVASHPLGEHPLRVHVRRDASDTNCSIAQVGPVLCP